MLCPGFVEHLLPFESFKPNCVLLSHHRRFPLYGKCSTSTIFASQMSPGWCYILRSVKVMERISTGFEMLPASESFESVFSNNYSRIFGLLFRMTGSRMEAEDLTQEVFWKLWKTPPANPSNQVGWLYRVAIRLGYNALRSMRRRVYYERRASLGVQSETNADAAIECEGVRQILRLISQRSAQLLMLHHSGFSYKEIAEALQISPNSIGTLLIRAEKEFEQKWEAHTNASK
jgi:RNA polymerase sigma-70 factor (ECF subfamily)